MAKVIKISEMSKDFGMKSKDVIEGFKEIKIEKNSGASVTDVEFEVFMQHMTSTHQMKDIEAYTSGKTTIRSVAKKAAKTEAPKAETAPKTEAAPKVEAKPEVKPATTRVRKAPKAEPAPAPETAAEAVQETEA